MPNARTKAIDDGQPIDVAYLDIAKAFDTVNHEILLMKLEAAGISGAILAWCSGFLRNRTQRVKVGCVLSEAAIVKSGVPQGSVLGPLLFLVYINDIAQTSTTSDIKIFADDTKIFKRVPDIGAHSSFATDVNNALEWAEKNRLVIAKEKSVVGT